MPFVSFSYNLLHDTYIDFQKNADNFEKAHKTCSILVWDTVPPKMPTKQNSLQGSHIFVYEFVVNNIAAFIPSCRCIIIIGPIPLQRLP